MNPGQAKANISADAAAALRSLPAVEEVLETGEISPTIESFGRELAVRSIRKALDRIREKIISGEKAGPGGFSLAMVAQAAAAEAKRIALPNLVPLINASGVIVHTNLGRSILAEEAVAAVSEIAGSYSNLEYDLIEGRRGSRHDHIADLIVSLTGAEDALVVNNNAAAVLLLLAVFGSGREVVVSRGELIEIGGSFRIPDIMASSTARLVEVGTTNKTRLSDYEGAIGPDIAMLLHVHTSNYKVVGFTAEVKIGDLVQLGHGRGIVVAHDLGSGALASLPALADEPSVEESLKAGVDVITFSGDKLLGGPQAGIVLGKSKYIKQMKQHPMARAMRVDKMTLAALQATLALYLKPETAMKRIPTLRMLSESEESLKVRAEKLAASLRKGAGNLAQVGVERAPSKVGGGSLPLLELDSYVCSINPAAISVDELAARLRLSEPPVIGRIHVDRLMLDLRTVLPAQLEILATAVTRALVEEEK